jgi:hypothetical protein
MKLRILALDYSKISRNYFDRTNALHLGLEIFHFVPFIESCSRSLSSFDAVLRFFQLLLKNFL